MEEKRLSVNYAKDLLDQLFPFPGIVLSGKGFHLGCDHYGAVKNHFLVYFSAWPVWEDSLLQFHINNKVLPGQGRSLVGHSDLPPSRRSPIMSTLWSSFKSATTSTTNSSKSSSSMVSLSREAFRDRGRQPRRLGVRGRRVVRPAAKLWLLGFLKVWVWALSCSERLSLLVEFCRIRDLL